MLVSLLASHNNYNDKNNITKQLLPKLLIIIPTNIFFYTKLLFIVGKQVRDRLMLSNYCSLWMCYKQKKNIIIYKIF